ncbi:tetratricopeptide repeat protein [Deinococcus aestuarii]|uniref:tetratricopeptide repeat protein n=1 Tax=Deinococcus aestuarii TaxID=2774531 RepID=UPI001C0BF92D|nr:tetratricopeptide repeat protein [Deinococcus aestuarii]
MGRPSEVFEHVQVLLLAEAWAAAALHVRQAARQVASRAQAQMLRALVGCVPPHVRLADDWPEALLWTAYRANDLALADEVLDADSPGRWPAFEAYRASRENRWPATLRWAETALEGGLEGRSAVVAARFRACALEALGRPEWPEAFAEAYRISGRRDRGLLSLEWGVALIRAGQEGAAREILARALPELRGDDRALTLTLANLGIACLRTGDLEAAERALREAVRMGTSGEGVGHVSTAWRGLGGLYLRWGQWARAEHAYAQAIRTSDNVPDSVMAMRSSAEVMRLRGHLDEALSRLHDALRHEGVPDGMPHPLYIDLAALSVRLGHQDSAADLLALARHARLQDDWRETVVRAELCRLGGEEAVAGELLCRLEAPAWWTDLEAQVFPEVFTLVGRQPQSRVWTARLSADGPLRLKMNGRSVELSPVRPAASLLAFLVAHRGSAATERVLEALDLPGNGERQRRQALSRVVTELRAVLGWPGAVQSSGTLLTLSPEVCWEPLLLPPPEHADTFCEGRLDPWVVDWRSAHESLSFSE